MKRVLTTATAIVAASALMVGCGDGDTSTENTIENEATYSATEAEVRNTIGFIRSLQLGMVSSGISQSFSAQLGMPVVSTRVDYPALYEKERPCGKTGTVSSSGTKLNPITYDVNNTYNECTHIDGVNVNGTQKVFATFANNKLNATMTDNNITVSQGDQNIHLTSPFNLYADRDFSRIEIILEETGRLSKFGVSYQAFFNDFNVTLDTQSNSMYLNGFTAIENCGHGEFTIETIDPVVPAVDGSYTSGELNINGALYEYRDDGTVNVTLGSGMTLNLPQGIEVVCVLNP